MFIQYLSLEFKTKLSSYIEIFLYKFVNYDKKKRGQKYETDAADGTNVNTGHSRGSIRYLEMFLGVPLQWDICLLHLNELPLRHIFMKIDGTTKGPDKFSGAIGSQLNGNVSKWGVAKFRPILWGAMVYWP